MKNVKTVAKAGILVITTLTILTASFPRIVNASQTSQNDGASTVSVESEISKKGKKPFLKKKAKFENLTDEEKEALKAKRKAKFENLTDEQKEALKAERKAKFENLTDEQKEALKAKRKNKKSEKKIRKNNDVLKSENE